VVGQRTSTAPSCSPASGRRLLHRTCRLHRAASDLRGALANLSGSLPFGFLSHIRIFGAPQRYLHGHFLAQREKLHSNLLGLHVSNGDWLTDQNIMRLTAGLYAKSSGLVTAGARAVDLIAARLASSGIQPQHYRWIPADRLELRVRADSCRSVAQITVELRRPQHGPADTGHREGVETMKRKAILLLMATGGCLALLPGRRNKRQRPSTAAITLHEAVQLALSTTTMSHRWVRGR